MFHQGDVVIEKSELVPGYFSVMVVKGSDPEITSGVMVSCREDASVYNLTLVGAMRTDRAELFLAAPVPQEVANG